MTCTCLSCIEGFGRCSSTSICAESTARGVDSFRPATKQQELEAIAQVFGVAPQKVKAWDLGAKIQKADFV